VPEGATGTQLANLEQARDDVASAEATLKNTRLVAPISGTVIKVDVVAGEYAALGEIVIVINDVETVRVETTDLSERDVSSVQIGQPAIIHIDSLNQDVTGRVDAISPVADTLGGDVVYKTTLELDERPNGILAGMSVEVQFGATP
jgi:multidrug resistance efflux pump